MEDPKSEIPSAAEVKEEVISGLAGAVKSFNDGDITSLKMLKIAFSAWRRVNEDSQLKQRLEEEMRRRRQALNAMGVLDMSGGDPIMKRYNPNYWLGDTPPEFKGKEEIFIIDRMDSLSNLFESL